MSLSKPSKETNILYFTDSTDWIEWENMLWAKCVPNIIKEWFEGKIIMSVEPLYPDPSRFPLKKAVRERIDKAKAEFYRFKYGLLFNLVINMENGDVVIKKVQEYRDKDEMEADTFVEEDDLISK